MKSPKQWKEIVSRHVVLTHEFDWENLISAIQKDARETAIEECANVSEGMEGYHERGPGVHVDADGNETPINSKEITLCSTGKHIASDIRTLKS